MKIINERELLFKSTVANIDTEIDFHTFITGHHQHLFVCVEVLRPSQPSWVMLSAVSLHNNTLTGQALSCKRLTSIVHILSQKTDTCPSWISGRERMTVESISWSISTKECCRPRRGVEPATSWSPVGRTSNWATEAGSLHEHWAIAKVPWKIIAAGQSLRCSLP